jgi:hypothetical protein
VSKSKIFESCGITGKEKVAALGVKGKFGEHAIKSLEILLK